MNRKLYRMCLIMVILVMSALGIWYYQFSQNQEIYPKKAAFVWMETAGSACV